jgi:hypothetical protein
MDRSAAGRVKTLGRVGGTGNGAHDTTIILELDGVQFAKAVYKANRDETQRVGVRLAGGYA